MQWLDKLAAFWPHLAAGFVFLAALLAAIHAILNKRDSRAALLWIGVVWLLPLVGPVLYLAFGVNRIRRRAHSLGVGRAAGHAVPQPISKDMGEPHQIEAGHLRTLAHVVNRVVMRPMMAGNNVQALMDGDEAFPAMLAAIESATVSVSLLTYIFDNDSSGKRFAKALGAAVARGVHVRVLVDDAGSRYSWPSITRELKRLNVPVARFLPTLAPWRFTTMNLHNHRKLLVVDGRIGFAGGINIRHGNMLKENPKRPVRDLHFRLDGPVVAQLQEAFVNDWAFCTREILSGEEWFPLLSEAGKLIARAIPDGPDADFEKVRWTLLGAISCAQTSIRILSPYFLPDHALISALNIAALRGVTVDIILPGRSNLVYLDWASRALWWQVLERGCRIWLTVPPFDHSKLMIVDGHWVFFGSANWDPRSLRLNFELNVECYGRDFASQMETIVEDKLRGAKRITLAEIDGRSGPVRLRDNIARLFTPYL
jgi:cardiolipin synthase